MTSCFPERSYGNIFPSPTLPLKLKKPFSSCWTHGCENGSGIKADNFISSATGQVLLARIFYFPRKEFPMNKRAYHIPPSSAECRQCKSYRPDIGCSEISCIQLKAAINDGTVTYRDLLMTIYPQPPTLGWKIQELAGTYLCKLWHDANHHARFHFSGCVKYS